MIFKYIAGPIIGSLIGYFTNFIAVKMLFHPKKEIRIRGHRLPFTPGAIPKGKSRLAKSVGEAVGNNLITQADIEDKLLSEELTEKIADTIISKFSQPFNSLSDGLSDMTEEEIVAKREDIAKSVGKFMAEAVSQVDIAEIIVQKAPEIIKEKLNNPMIEMFLTDDILRAVLTPVGSEIQKFIAEHGEEYISPYVSQRLSDAENGTIVDFVNQLGIEQSQLKSIIKALYKKAVSGCSENLMQWLDLSGIVESKINAMSADELETLVMSVMKKELNTIVNLGALIGFVLGLLNIFI